MAFSASEAAFEGFRLARRSPVTIVIWAALYIVFTVAILALVGGSIATILQQAAALEGATNPSPEDLVPMMTAYFSMMGLLFPLSIVFGAVLYAAVNRAVVRPEEKSFGYLRLGGDELRVFVVYLALTLLGMIGMGLLFLVVGVLAGVLTASVNEGVGVLAGVLGGLAAVAVAIWVLVRLSLALPITVAEKRIAIFDSWSLTKGHFWGLLGMAILAFILAMVVQALAWMVFMPFVFLMGGSFASLAGANLDSVEPMQLLATLGPIAIVGALFMAVVSALQLAIMYAPYAAAYRDLKDGGELRQPESEAAPEPVV